MSQPAHKLRDGCLSVIIWRNTSHSGQTYYTANPVRSYKLVPHHGNGLSRKSEIPYLTRSLDCEEIDRWQGRPRR